MPQLAPLAPASGRSSHVWAGQPPVRGPQCTSRASRLSLKLVARIAEQPPPSRRRACRDLRPAAEPHGRGERCSGAAAWRLRARAQPPSRKESKPDSEGAGVGEWDWTGVNPGSASGGVAPLPACLAGLCVSRPAPTHSPSADPEGSSHSAPTLSPGAPGDEYDSDSEVPGAESSRTWQGISSDTRSLLQLLVAFIFGPVVLSSCLRVAVIDPLLFFAQTDYHDFEITGVNRSPRSAAPPPPRARRARR